jgi:hypothetical protein
MMRVCPSGRDLKFLYYHSNRDFEIHDSHAISLNIINVHIVAMGSDECTLIFETEVEAEHHLKWYNWDSGEEASEWVIDYFLISGNAQGRIGPSDSQNQDDKTS